VLINVYNFNELYGCKSLQNCFSAKDSKELRNLVISLLKDVIL
jgi:hypothetical protein